jgi:hypothetical protein
VQRLVIVANKKTLDKISGEVATLSEDFRKLLSFVDVREITRAITLLQELNDVLQKFELVKPLFTLKK